MNRGSLADRPLQDQMRALQSQLQGLKRQITEIDNRLVNDNLATIKQHQTLNENIKRIGLSPGRPIRYTTSQLVSADISLYPRTLYELWNE